MFNFWKNWEYKSTGGKVWTIIFTGLIGAPVLFLAAFLIEFVIWFLTCGKASGEPCGIACVLPIWEEEKFGYTLAFLSGAGFVIGIIYAIAVKAQESSENHRVKNAAKAQKNLEQRQGYAAEFRRKSSDVKRQCEYNKRISEETELHPHYEAITLQKKLWDALDYVSTSLQLLDDKINRLTEKHDTEVVKLNEYRKKRDELQKQAQDKIAILEEVEKELHELAIDYKIAVREFEYSVNAIYSNSERVGNRSDNISMEERDSWMEELQIVLSQSNQEIENMKKLESTDEHYLEYSRKEERQSDIISDIEKNISKINSIGSEVNGLL